MQWACSRVCDFIVMRSTWIRTDCYMDLVKLPLPTRGTPRAVTIDFATPLKSLSWNPRPGLDAQGLSRYILRLFWDTQPRICRLVRCCWSSEGLSKELEICFGIVFHVVAVECSLNVELPGEHFPLFQHGFQLEDSSVVSAICDRGWRVVACNDSSA